MEKSSTELGVLKELDAFLKLWRGRSINEAILIDNEVDERFLPFQQSPPSCISSRDVLGFALEWARQILHTLNCPPLFADAIARLVIESYYSDFEVEPVRNIEGADDLWSKVVSQVDNVLRNLTENGLDPAVDERWNVLVEGDKSRYSDFAIKNGRRTMEDVHVVMPQLHTLLGLQSIPPTGYYAVFDGHAGIKAAHYAATHLHQKIANIPSFKTDDLSDAIRQGVKLTDEGFMAHCNFQEQSCKSGCTVVCCFIRSDKLWLAWVGDSQGVVFSEGNVTAITTPHKPERQDERERIERTGGCVVHMGTWRVNGTLAVSRAIGDIENKPFVTSEPDILEIKREGVDFVLLACDGMWDVLSDENVADIAYSYFGTYAKENDGPGLAEKLVTEAKIRGSSDNITVLVIYLQDYAKLHETYIHLAGSDSLSIKKTENNLVDFGEKGDLSNKDCGFLFNSQSFHAKTEYTQEWSSAKNESVSNSFTNFQVTTTSSNDFGSFGSLSEPNNFENLTKTSDETDFTRFKSNDFCNQNVDIENPLRDVFETAMAKNFEADLGGEFDLKELEKGELVEESLLLENFDSKIGRNAIMKEQQITNSFSNRDDTSTSPMPYFGSTLSPDAEPFVSRYSNQNKDVSSDFEPESAEFSNEFNEKRETVVEVTKFNSNPFAAELNLNQYSTSAISEEQQNTILEFEEKEENESNEKKEIDVMEAFKDEISTFQTNDFTECEKINIIDDRFKDVKDETKSEKEVEVQFENDDAIIQPVIQNIVFDADVMVPEVKLVYTESPYSEVPPSTFETSITTQNENFELSSEFDRHLSTKFEDLKIESASDLASSDTRCSTVSDAAEFREDLCFVAQSDQGSHDMEIGGYEAFKEHLDSEPNLISYELQSSNAELISNELMEQQRLETPTQDEIPSYENLQHTKTDFEALSHNGASEFDDFLRSEAQQYETVSNVETQQFEALSNAEAQQYEALSNAETQQFEALSNAEAQQYEALSNAETRQFEALSNTETQQFEALSNNETQQFEALSNTETQQFEALSNAETQQFEAASYAEAPQFTAVSNSEAAQFEAASNIGSQEFNSIAETHQFEALSNTETQKFEDLCSADSHQFETVSAYGEEERRELDADFESQNVVSSIYPTSIELEPQQNLLDSSSASTNNVVADVEDDESEDGEGWKFYSSQATNGGAEISSKIDRTEGEVLITSEPTSETNIQVSDSLPALSTQLKDIVATNVVAVEPSIQTEAAEQLLKATPKAKTTIKAKAPIGKASKSEPIKSAIIKTATSKPSASTAPANKEVKKPITVTKPLLKSTTKTAKTSEPAKNKATTTATTVTKTTVTATSAAAKKPLIGSLKPLPAVGTKRVTANGTANGVAKEAKPIHKTTEGAAKVSLAKKTLTSTTTTNKPNSGTKESAPLKKSTTTTVTSKVNSGTVSNRTVSATSTLVKADKQVKEATNKNLSTGTRAATTTTRTTSSSAATTKLSVTNKSTAVTTTSTAATKTTTTSIKSNLISNGIEKKAKPESPKATTTPTTKLATKSPVAGPSTRLSPNKMTPPAAKSSPLKIMSPSTPKVKALSSTLSTKSSTSSPKTNRISTSTPKPINGINSKKSKINHVEKGTIDARSKEVLKTGGDSAAEGGIVDPKIELEFQNGFEKIGNGVDDNVLHHSSANGSIMVAEDMH